MSTAHRPLSAPHRRFEPSQWALSVALALAVVGFVGAAQWNASLARSDFTTSAQQALAAQVFQLEQEQAVLRAEIAAAEAELQAAQQAAEGSESALRDLNERLATARASVGLTALRGPGVRIEIADSNRVVPPGANLSNYLVLVDDLRDVVTALWASGAEGIAINGERLVASSSIYGVGASVLINTDHFQPPFTIGAVGPEGLLERFSEHPAFAGRVRQRIDAYGLQYATAVEPELDLQPFVGDTRLRWAVPVAETP